MENRQQGKTMSEYQPIINAATDIIKQVMEAGAHQRTAQGKSTDEWKTAPVIERMHHAFMHLVATETSMETNGHPFSLTSNTALEDWKHALCGLAIVAAHELGYMDFSPIIVDTTDAEISGE